MLISQWTSILFGRPQDLFLSLAPHQRAKFFYRSPDEQNSIAVALARVGSMRGQMQLGFCDLLVRELLLSQA